MDDVDAGVLMQVQAIILERWPNATVTWIDDPSWGSLLKINGTDYAVTLRSALSSLPFLLHRSQNQKRWNVSGDSDKLFSHFSSLLKGGSDA